MREINASIGVDKRLYAEDIEGSRAHAAMLAAQGIIAKADAEAIDRGLAAIGQEIATGAFVFKDELEDIHMNIEARLGQLIGAPAGRLHTARSRNDQVATDFKLWVRRAIDAIDENLRDFIAILIDRAEAEAATIMPGYTHLQPAQPITFGHHLLAWVEMLGRDRSRLRDAKARAEECPLGAAALAGTSFPIDRQATASALGFARPSANSLDAVSDRDFALDYLAALSILAMHLSRMAEEIVLWMSEGFGFIRLSDRFTTGSSIMPQKRNPDAAELVRAKAGEAIAAFLQVIVILKGLPLAYGKDMQDDKAPTFAATDTIALALAAMTGMAADMIVDRERMAAACSKGYLAATDLADWLVGELGLPFRAAHHIAGSLVGLAAKRGIDLAELPLAEMQRLEPRISASVYDVLSIANAVERRRSFGGTAPDNVRAAAAAARARFL